MREGIFIIFVVFVLLGLTAIRYRKQIAALLELSRVIRGSSLPSNRSGGNFPGSQQSSIPLVNCSHCGVWVPQNKARKIGEVFFCSDECVQLQKPARK